MNQILRAHADQIVRGAIEAVLPDAAVQRALSGMDFPGRVLLAAAGKAAWQMARAASDCLGSRIERGCDHQIRPRHGTDRELCLLRGGASRAG